MRISKKQIFSFMVGGLVLVLFFQNCGQPGTIATNAIEGVKDVPVDPNDPNGPVYRAFQKTVKVNSANSQVDILVVVDNSGSMATEQKSMGDRFDTFIDQLQGLDWRVAITTTDVAKLNSAGQPITAENDGRLVKMEGTQKYFLSKTDDPAMVKQIFKETVQREERGSGWEQGIRATFRSLERAQAGDASNASFLRSSAALAVVVVSDADETIEQADIRNDGQKLRDFISVTLPSKAFAFHSIIVKKDDEPCLKLTGSGNEGYGLKYQSLSEKTGGIVGSVCETDYGTQLKAMGQATADLVNQVTLECEAVDQDKDGKVDVTITNIATQAQVTEFTVNKSQIQLAKPLAIGEYNVQYKCIVAGKVQ